MARKPENFDWRTEEHDSWDERLPVSDRTTSPRRLHLVIFSLGAAAILAGLLLYWQAKRQVTAVETAASGDVLAAHHLVWTAAQGEDEELFTSLLLDEEAWWLEAQRQLMTSNLLFAPRALGFQPLAVEPVSAQVTLSPELTTAEVQFELPYAVQMMDGMTETIVLRQTAAYQQKDGHWLLAPLPNAAWQVWLASQGRTLTLVYPRRDEAVAQRLAFDLDTALADMCRLLPDLHCPDDFHVYLRLESDPATLARAADLKTIMSNGRRLELPTPTLVGLPVDEAGYQALARGYAVAVVSAAITDLVGYECCRRGLFYQALLDKQLSWLGLRPWSLTPAGYDQLLLGGSWLEQADRLWNRPLLQPDEAGQPVYALVDFLVETTGETSFAVTNLSEMQRQLAQHATYLEWVAHLVGGESQVETFYDAWLTFIDRHTASAQQATPPVPWPAQVAQLFCRSTDEQTVVRHEYDPATAAWSQTVLGDYDSTGRTAVFPLPGGEKYIGSYQLASDSQTTTSRIGIWRLGVLVAQVQNSTVRSDLTLFFTGQTDPTGRYLVFAGNAGRQFALLDRESCRNEDCPLRPLPNPPVWSPDGSQTLLAGDTPPMMPGANALRRHWQLPLYLADAGGERLVEIGQGVSPFWVDDEHYGYVRLNEAGETELVTAALHDHQPQRRLRTANLLAAIQPNETGWRPEQLFIVSAQVNPADPTIWFVVASGSLQRDPPYAQFLVRQAPGQANDGRTDLLFQSQGQVVAHFSPDGRWLVLVYHHYERQETMGLLNLATGHMIPIAPSPFGNGTWSADGNWFLQHYGRYSLLIAPAHNYQRLILPPVPWCDQAQWSAAGGRQS